ncbi:hypothetical protein GMRT_15153 [Giardia muris]|uniref:C3H1-type domain-containing protein n=1 Tax=Giardia muris TaxID=5742 RepID=A0A4Z1T6D0_GIAMU|nr:hypothetical protein GMRT_15153 [Giardia muris]|eukprot:TNJ28089.1 hypothetical protein GMRT_15153 [Giardia muris]
MDDLMMQLFTLPDISQGEELVQEYARKQVPPQTPFIDSSHCQLPNLPISRATKLDRGAVLVEAFMRTLHFQTSRSKLICKFYLAGSCKRENCPYLHPPRD